ncbi:MAG: metal ABC transporter ATP-binding protein [Chloroflexota bacterium]|nr:metal ABC transporter ATP-binding protein [Chloroflexota bacterium]
MLSTRDLSVHFGSRSAIDKVTLDIMPGTIISVLGPNGAGKSTLLKSLAGVIHPSHGSVWFGDRELKHPVPDITYVPQRSGAEWTFPISVLETVLLGLSRNTPRWRPFTARERQQAIDALAHVGLEPLADVQIGALSGGQQQRVFLARALVACGEVLLLDEPFTGVDVPTQELFLGLFENLRKRGVTIVFATHDLEHAARSSTRAILINNTVIADGPPAEVLTDTMLTTTFQGRIMVFRESGAPVITEGSR